MRWKPAEKIWKLPCNTEEKSAPLASGWGKTIFLELKITAMAIGQPYV